MYSLSAVIPVYYDEEVLSELYKRLKPVVERLTSDYEIIFVEDGSKDRSFEILKCLYNENAKIKVLKQSRNFGQANSILAGLRYASKDYIVIMDSDLQDKPEDIEELITAMEENNVSMAIAKWETRKDTLKKKLASWVFYSFSQRITDMKYEQGLGVFRVIKRKAIEKLLDVPEITGSILSLLYWSGISYVPVPLKRDARFAGTSGYNLNKMLKLASDRIFSYSLLPMKLMINTGLIVAVLSFLFVAYIVIRKLAGLPVQTGWSSIIALLSFLFGVNFIFLGLLGEYIGRIYLESKKRPKYVTEIILDRDV
ncbi:MAG: glycosyltransferase [Candidatus Cloacimonadota bacterium]|nr:MAG: glycosyltransferase [Candidatus Cloacimonadota bacterium]